MASLQGKVVLITGASSGIGEALVNEYAKRGAHLVLVARRTERIEALAEKLRGRAQALAVAGDVTRDGDLEQAVKQALEKFGRLDVVIANAGFGVVGNVEDLSVDDYRRQFDTNVYGVIRTVKATLTELKKTAGSFALVGSVQSYVVLPGTTAYSMSKHAVRALSFGLSAELVSEGISVTHVAPGFIRTEIRNVDNQGIYREGSSPYPIPAKLIMPAEIAAFQIVDAIQARRKEVVITLHGKFAVWMERHLPWITSFAITRMGVKGRNQPKQKNVEGPAR